MAVDKAVDKAAAVDTVVAVDYEALFRVAPCGYLLLDDEGRITDVNDTFVTWTGRDRSALLGTRFDALLPVGDRILYATTVAPALRGGGAVAEILLEVLAADRTRRPALLSALRVPATVVPVTGTGTGGVTGADVTVPAQTRVVVFSAHERRRYEAELVGALRRAERSEAERASAEADLAHAALHDPVTGLVNRAGLVQHLQQVLTRQASSGACLQMGVLVVNIDHFRAVNDGLGHAAGDELLGIVAGRLLAAVRTEAVVARVSGDEFAVAGLFGAAVDVGALAQRLLDSLSLPVVLQGVDVVVTASIGASLTGRATTEPQGPDGSGRPDESAAPGGADRGEAGGTGAVAALLRRADLATYQAKAAGRNRWQLHEPAPHDPAADHLRVLGELRGGIGRDELRLRYQPRVDLATGTLDGVEALVRWQHPARGLLAPDAFIGIAEASGLIRRLGAWVLEEAAAQAVRWQAGMPGRHPVAVAVNLSARQLNDPDLVSLVQDCLDRTGLDPSLLTLEITETAIMGDAHAALGALRGLKALGVSLAVDDFGTGYASLTYLKDFPVDELKIDRSFVQGLGRTAGDTAIVTACVQLAHALGLRAVAEGVETDEQRTALLALGCDLAQGYHYAPPLPAHEIADWAVKLPCRQDGAAQAAGAAGTSV